MTNRNEALYWNGVETGRLLCLTKGHAAAQARLARLDLDDPARAGLARAIWDYEDANGLPHDPLNDAM